MVREIPSSVRLEPTQATIEMLIEKINELVRAVNALERGDRI